MTKLSGAAAEARLDKAWERIFSQDPSLQQIIHVLARPTEYPIWLTDFSPFEAWMRNGCEANDEVWRTFAEIATSWPYIYNARRAIAFGIPNARIFVLKRTQWDSAPSWLHYLAEVHLPAIAGLTGETLYRVWLEDCRNSGLPDRDYDVNLYGADGVMLAGYQDGDVNWRVFLADSCNPDAYRKEHDFITSMRDFASTGGEMIKPLPEIQLVPIPGQVSAHKLAVASPAGIGRSSGCQPRQLGAFQRNTLSTGVAWLPVLPVMRGDSPVMVLLGKRA